MDYQKASQQEDRALIEACRRGNVENAATILENHLRSVSNQPIAFQKSVSEGERIEGHLPESAGPWTRRGGNI